MQAFVDGAFLELPEDPFDKWWVPAGRIMQAYIPPDGQIGGEPWHEEARRIWFGGYDMNIERIRKISIQTNNDVCMGQVAHDASGNVIVAHKLNLRFVPRHQFQPFTAALVSSVSVKDKTITLYLDEIAGLLEREGDPSNAVISKMLARIILREVWWYNKGDDHETTVAVFTSPETKQAFEDGYDAARRRHNTGG